MAAVSLSINGGPAVLLEPDTVYRIGRKETYEFCVAAESMELYHALATVYRSGVLRVNALLGKVFVNDVENGNADISQKDAIDGKVKLRFGNVEAEVQLIEPLQHHDSSGFGEALKDTSADTTIDSLVIPETEVPSANTSANTTADSFFVPETQAVGFDSSSKGGKVSLGDEFVIPETQDLPSSVVVHNEAGNSNDGEGSDTGSQIRICTQDFNQFDEDALEDFDSSMMLGDAVAPLSVISQFFEEKIGHYGDATDLELTNSKCTALNSTKAGDLPPREVACITPDLSGQNPSHIAGNCTPDLFDLMDAGGDLEERSATPTLCGLKQLIVATIETPAATPLEGEDKENQDFIVPQSKVPASESLPQNRNEINETNQDLIATQPFPFTLMRKQEGLQAIETLKDRSAEKETNQDFIATQPFPFTSKFKRGGLPSINSPEGRSNGEETNESFTATQSFPSQMNLKRMHAAASTKDSSDNEENEDLIASRSKQAKLQEIDSPADHGYSKTTQQNNEKVPVENMDAEAETSTSGDEAALDSLKYDDIMEILSEMGAGHPLPPDDPNEPQIKFVEPSIIKDEDYNAKVARMESVFPTRNDKQRRRLPRLPEAARSRIVGSESPPRTTRSALQRRLSDESPRIQPRKRPANAENSGEPQTKIMRPPWNLFIAEEAKRAASEESTPEMLAKKRSSNSKTSTTTKLDSASSSKAKKAVEHKKEEDVVANEIRGRLRNRKAIEKRREEAADNGNTSAEGVGEHMPSRRGIPPRRLRTNPVSKKEAETEKADTAVKRKATKREAETEKPNTSAEVKRRVGRPRKSQTPTPLDTTESKIKKQKPPENANNSPVVNRWVGRLRKSKTPTGDDPIKSQIGRSETPPTTARITRRNAAKDEPKEESHSKAAVTRKLVVKVKQEKPIKSGSGIEEEIDEPTTSTAAAIAQQNEMPGKRGRTRSSKGTVPSSQENALKAINQHVRNAKRQGKIKIAFSKCNLEELASVLKALKHYVEKTDDPLNCDILVMDKGERTYKFLVGIAANKPILSSSWLQSMRASSRVTVEAEHLFSDSNFEKMYEFNPLMALQNPQLLSGLNFMLCEGIQPNQKEMTAIIESAGGKVYTKPPVLQQKLYVIGVAKDINRHKRLIRNQSNAQCITTEGIMKTLVQHNLELLNDPKVQI